MSDEKPNAETNVRRASITDAMEPNSTTGNPEAMTGPSKPAEVTGTGDVEEGDENAHVSPAQPYRSLLVKLHRLFNDGAGDSAEADAIREKMLDLWNLMTVEEQERARALSVEMKREARDDAMAKEGPDTLTPGVRLGQKDA